MIMDKVNFIGNCQMLSLCVIFNQLFSDKYAVRWISYAERFLTNLGAWNKKAPDRKEDKCTLITDPSVTLADLKLTANDIVIHQGIQEKTSEHYNAKKINELSCKKLQLPSIHWNPENPETIAYMRQNEKMCDISVTSIIEQHDYTYEDLFHTPIHPKTSLLILIVREIADKLSLSVPTEKYLLDEKAYFTEKKFDPYLLTRDSSSC